MQHTRHIAIVALVLLSLLLLPPSAVAGGIDKEIWMGAGFSWPDYGEGVMACARGGFGLVFARYAGLGISTQVDRERVCYFGDVSVFFPQLDVLSPYGRFQYGHRDDKQEAMGWAAGVRIGGGEEYFHIYLEGHQVFEPESNYGFSLGISF